jgi:hypothetical protein
MAAKRDDGMGIMEKAKSTHEQLNTEFDAIFR